MRGLLDELRLAKANARGELVEGLRKMGGEAGRIRRPRATERAVENVGDDALCARVA